MVPRPVKHGTLGDLLHAVRRREAPVLVPQGAASLVSIAAVRRRIWQHGAGVVLRPRRGANIVSAEYEKWSRRRVAAAALLEGRVRGQARLDLPLDAIEMPRGLRVAEDASAVFVTSRGLRTPLHSDPHDGLLAHIVGRKRFVFIHPSDSDVDPERLRRLLGLRRASGTVTDLYHTNHHADLAAMRCFVGDLEPGDLLYVPRRWLHDFESIDASISLAIRFDELAHRHDPDRCVDN